MTLPPLTAKDPTKLKSRGPVLRTNYDFSAQTWNTMNEQYGAGKITGIHDFMEKKRTSPSPIKLWQERRKKRKKKAGAVDVVHQEYDNAVNDLARRHIQNDDVRKYRTLPDGRQYLPSEEHRDALNDLAEGLTGETGAHLSSRLSDLNLIAHFDFVFHDDYGVFHEHPMARTKRLNEMRAEMDHRRLEFEEAPLGVSAKPGQNECKSTSGRRYFYWREADMWGQPRKEVEFTPAHEQLKEAAFLPPLSATAEERK